MSLGFFGCDKFSPSTIAIDDIERKYMNCLVVNNKQKSQGSPQVVKVL